ncbi:hypothetical protein BDY24DRAFT_396829 [Mrakia frigida]|uniref:uncharacterized protein n=1 Tax=Mrakia frigida TaxID=29902 RepID=UPI003FCC246A
MAASSSSASSSAPSAPPAPRGPITLTIKWGKEKLFVPLPLPPFSTTLLALRSQLSQLTSLPPQSFKLVFAGGVMTDDKLLLSQYGIKDGSTLAIIGKPGAKEQIMNVERELGAARQAGGAGGEKKKGAGEQLQTQPKLVESIRAKVKATREALGGQVEEFEEAAANGPVPTPSTPAYATLQKQHATLGEQLLQLLLWLDGVQCPATWEEARRERKEGVRDVQGWLDRVDKAWKGAKDRAAHSS